MRTIWLDANKVPPHLRGGYTGKQFRAIIGDTVTIPHDAGIWSGGSRSTYRHCRMADGATIEAANHNAAPWDPDRRDVSVTLAPGQCVIKHSIFSGRDMGLTFYMRADDVAPMLPAPSAPISDTAIAVLDVIAGIKSNYRADEYARRNLSPEQVGAAKSELFDAGLIDKRGAVTVAGRNARVKP